MSLLVSFITLTISFVSLYYVVTLRDNNAQSRFLALEGSLRLLETHVTQTETQATALNVPNLITKNQTYNSCLSNTSNTCSQLTNDIQYVQSNLTYIKTIENINTLYLITNLSCSIGVTALQTKIAMVSVNSNIIQVVQEGTFQISPMNTSSTYSVQKMNLNQFELYYTIYRGGWTPGMNATTTMTFYDFVPPLSDCANSVVSLGKRPLLEFQNFGGTFQSVERFCDNDRLVFYGNGGGIIDSSKDFIKLV